MACRQIELALVIYLCQFYAQQQIFQVHCTLAQLQNVTWTNKSSIKDNENLTNGLMSKCTAPRDPYQLDLICNATKIIKNPSLCAQDTHQFTTNL